MEIALLCEVKVMLCIVDKKEKVVLYSSEDLKTFLTNYIYESVRKDNYQKTENVKKVFKYNLNLVQ